MKKLSLTLLVFLLAACGSTTRGQVVFHWDRYNTGGLKFARDHSECMREAEAFKLLPNFKSWFYTEEQRYNIVVKWHKEHGIWASFVCCVRGMWNGRPIFRRPATYLFTSLKA